MDIGNLYVAGVVGVMALFLAVLAFVTFWSRGAR